MRAYYNENDPDKAEWLRELIRCGEIAAGDVDQRSIAAVQPADLRGYSQHHFFAGIGGWSLALRLAGVPDDRSVWTGSCPCPPFSEAGKGMAFASEDHLWPEWFRLIRECRPTGVFGEQVASAIRWGWLDTVANGLEEIGYAFGATPIPACAVGSKQVRKRVWFLAHPEGERWVFQRRLSLKEGSNSAGTICDWPAEPDIPVTLDGVHRRMVYVRGFGDCIHPHVAAEFIKALEN